MDGSHPIKTLRIGAGLWIVSVLGRYVSAFQVQCRICWLGHLGAMPIWGTWVQCLSGAPGCNAYLQVQCRICWLGHLGAMPICRCNTAGAPPRWGGDAMALPAPMWGGSKHAHAVAHRVAVCYTSRCSVLNVDLDAHCDAVFCSCYLMALDCTAPSGLPLTTNPHLFHHLPGAQTPWSIAVHPLWLCGSVAPWASLPFACLVL